jgi:predicted PolB exonuclease-like 3'-5' exonuclease
MTAWAGARGTISMDNLSEALGMHGKGDFTGADVAEAWANGEHHKIADYCADDVRRTREIWRRFAAVGW